MLTWMEATQADVEVIPGVFDDKKILQIHQNTSLNFFLLYSGLENKTPEKLTELAVSYTVESFKKYSELLGDPATEDDIREEMASDAFKAHIVFLVTRTMMFDPDYWKDFLEFYQAREQQRQDME